MKRSPTLLRFSARSLCLLMALVAVGCLCTETTEYTVKMNEDGKSGTLITVMRNIQSSDTDPAKQDKDFEQAIQSWKGDEYLLQRMKEGLYVKDRHLSVEGNVLVWREVAIFSDIADVFKHEVENDTLRFIVKDDQKITSTNGAIHPSKDSTVVVWALPKTREITLTIKENDFAPKSDFVGKFKVYMNQSK